MLIIETCVDNAFDAVKVLSLQNTPEFSRRVEMCSELDKEGLTPTIDALNSIAKEMKPITAPLSMRLMVRPPPKLSDDTAFYSFVHCDDDIQWMINKIAEFASLNAKYDNLLFEGFVFGCLKRESDQSLSVHADHMSLLLNAVSQASVDHNYSSYKVTFHKAFDLVRSSVDAIMQLKELNKLHQHMIDYVLTSGAENASDLSNKVVLNENYFLNINRLCELESGIEIMPGGGVRNENVKLILSKCPTIKAIHSSTVLCTYNK